MLNNNQIRYMRSEAARVGYFGLPIQPVLDHAKGAIQNSYIELKEKIEKKIRSFQSVKESINSNIEVVGNRIKESKIDTMEIICASIIIFVISAVLILWKDLILAPISVEYIVPFGFLIAGATMSGVYAVVQNKQGRSNNDYIEYGIVGFVIITTFIFSLRSSEHIFILKSLVIAGFVGLITFITNRVFLSTLKGSMRALVYMKDIIIYNFFNLVLLFLKSGLNKYYSTLKNTHRKMIQELNENKSMLLIDFMLGKQAKQKNIKIGSDKKEKELYHA